MKRRLIWTVVITVMVLIGTGIGVWRNLYNNAYYYATHMPYQKDYYPVVEVIGYKPLPESVNKIYQSDINYDIKHNNVDGRGESGGVERYNVFKKNDEFLMAFGTASYKPSKKMITNS